MCVRLCAALKRACDVQNSLNLDTFGLQTNTRVNCWNWVAKLIGARVAKLILGYGHGGSLEKIRELKSCGIISLLFDKLPPLTAIRQFSIHNSTISLLINKFRGCVDMRTYTFTTSYLHAAHYVIPLNTICCHPRNSNHSNN